MSRLVHFLDGPLSGTCRELEGEPTSYTVVQLVGLSPSLGEEVDYRHVHYVVRPLGGTFVGEVRDAVVKPGTLAVSP